MKHKSKGWALREYKARLNYARGRGISAWFNGRASGRVKPNRRSSGKTGY